MTGRHTTVSSLLTAGALTVSLLGTGLAAAAVPTPPTPVLAGVSLLPSIDVTATDTVGSLGGQFRVDESGSANYSLAFNLPEGTAGVAPQLGLSYSSQGGNGVVGKGWNLTGLSAISRCRQTVQQDGQAKPISWNSNDRFCLDGQRLIVMPGYTYGAAGSVYKTEMDSFAKVTAVGGTTGHPDYFTVERKDGSISYYGGAGAASVNNSEQGARNSSGAETTNVMTWAQREFQDSVGNKIAFTYSDDTTGHRIAQVDYAYASGIPNAKVTFDYQDRDDDILSYMAGYQFKEQKRLARVNVYNKFNGVWQQLRRYDLTYLSSASVDNRISRLSQVQECNAAGTSCSAPVTFSWNSRPLGVEATPYLDRLLEGQSDRVAFYRFADVNGDGRQDIVWLMVDGCNCSNKAWGKHYWQYAPATANGFGSTQLLLTITNQTDNVWEWRLLDYNGDGRMDLAVLPEPGSWTIYVSQPQSDGSWKPAGPGIIQSWDRDVRFTDVNSDGLVDRVEAVLSGGGRTGIPGEAHVRTNVLVRDGAKADSSNTAYVLSGSSVTYDADIATNVAPKLLESSGADFNGDGRADFFVYHDSVSYPTAAVNEAITTTNDSGGAQVYYTTKIINKEFAKLHQVADINGDGLSDIYYPDGGAGEYVKAMYLLNTGSGFTGPFVAEATNLIAGSPGYLDAIKKSAVTLQDYNGDGFADLVWHDYGNNQYVAKLWGPDTNTFSTTKTLIASTTGNTNHTYQLADVNGDGVLDYIHVTTGDVQTYLRIYLGKTAAGPHNSIAKISSGIGGANQTVINYGTLVESGHYVHSDIDLSGTRKAACQATMGSHFCDSEFYTSSGSFYTKLNGNWQLPSGTHSFGKDPDRNGVKDPVLEFGGAVHVVTSVQSSAPATTSVATTGSKGNPGASNQNATSSVSYFYRGARMQAMGRGLLGYEALMTRDDQTQVKTITTYRQDFPFIGQPLKTEVRTAQGHLLRESSNDWRLQGWNNTFNGNGSATYTPDYFQPYLFQSIDKTYDLANNGASAGTLLTTVTTDTLYDSYGNVTSLTVTTSGGGKNFRKETVNTYPSDTYSREMGRLSQATVTSRRDEDGNGSYELSDSRTSSFTYVSSGSLKGLLETETVEPLDANYTITTTYGYDSFGNKVRSAVTAGSDTRCNVNTAQYDATGRYVDLSYDCLGRTTSAVMQRNEFGAPVRVRSYTNADATAYVESHYSYTPRGVKVFEASDTGAFQGSTLALCDANNPCPTGAKYLAKSWGPGNGSSAIVELGREYFDILGRGIRKASRGFDGTWVYQDTEYDNLNRPARTSEPYFAGASTTYWSASVYDLLGRTTKGWLPDDTSFTITRSGFTTTTTNAAGQNKIETTNAIGEKVQVQDHLGGRIAFGYDAQGNLSKTTSLGSTTDPHNIVISLTYDRLGRKIAMSDPDKGDWSYQYSRFGELTRQTNAKGQYSVMAYDSLGRMIDRKDYLSDGSLEGHAQWTYDSAANGLGQLASVEDPVSGYIKLAEYDSFGRPAKTVTSLGKNGSLGDHYEKVTYDQYGRTFQVFDAARNGDTYTNNGVEHRYNAYGYQFQMVDAVYNSGVTRKVYQTVTAMDARGNVLTETLGNGVTRTLTYDAQNGRLTNILGQKSGGLALQDLDLVWDDIGNLTYKLESGYGAGTQQRIERESYTYDGLNRLKRTDWYESNTFTKSQSLNYNSLGNITYKSDVGNYLYEKTCGCGPHAVTKAGNTVYQYDANGNMVRDSSGRRIVYTSFDKTYRLTKDGNTVTFAYGPDRSRYLRTDTDASGTQTTLYIGSVEKITKADGTKEWKRYLSGNLMITQQVDGSGAITSEKSHYLLKDHLGSTNLILDGSGNVEQVLGFDPWGERLASHQNAGSVPWYSFQYHKLLTTRGFTGHEMVDKVGIIHMNGRIYDAKLARFLQADPKIDGVTSTQGYNRYSYVGNNPLNATDPTGYGFKDLFKNKWFNAALQIVAGVVGFWACGPACAGWAVGIVSGATVKINGGSWSDALRAGVISGVSTFAFASIGGATWSNLSPGAVGGAFIKSGLVGGIVSTLQGGSFGNGFLSAGISAAVPGFSGAGAFAKNLIQRAVVGGSISEATGGKFANGAITSAFAVLADGTAEALFRANRNTVGFTAEEASKGWTEEQQKVINSTIKNEAGIAGSAADGLSGELTPEQQTVLEGAFGTGADKGVVAGNFRKISDRLGNMSASGVKMIVGDTGGAYAYRQGESIYLSKTMMTDMLSGTYSPGVFIHEAAHMVGLNHYAYDSHIASYGRNGLDIASNFARNGNLRQRMQTWNNPYNYDLYLKNAGY